jgi:hypothetical protein
MLALVRVASILIALCVGAVACGGDDADPVDDEPDCDRYDPNGRLSVSRNTCVDARCVNEDAPPCSGPCTELDETACLAAAGCRATYEVYLAGSDPEYYGCWSVTEPLLEGADCATLELADCARADACGMTYEYSSANEINNLQYDSCVAEHRTESDYCADGDPACALVCQNWCGAPDAPPQCGFSCGDDAACGYLCRGRALDDATCAAATTPEECDAIVGCSTGYAGASCDCNAVDICRCESFTFVCTR